MRKFIFPYGVLQVALSALLFVSCVDTNHTETTTDNSTPLGLPTIQETVIETSPDTVLTLTTTVSRENVASSSTPVEPSVVRVTFDTFATPAISLVDAEVQPLPTLPLLTPMLEVASSYTPMVSIPTFIDRTNSDAAFVLKGEWMGGLSASIYSFETDNATMLLLLNSIEANGNITSIKPYGGYFYADNRCVGLRFGYTHYDAVLNLAELDLGESNDVSMTLPNVDLASNSFSYAAFHRSYTALDSRGRFGLFSDVECSYTHGITYLSYTIDGESIVADSRRQAVDILFCPGAAFYLLPNVCTTLSFGLGGFNYSRVEQLDELGVTQGWYESSDLSFKFNILAINFGITFHFW